jgi:hypothetical protein
VAARRFPVNPYTVHTCRSVQTQILLPVDPGPILCIGLAIARE